LAEAVVEDLADLFRAALSDAAGQSSLGRELELARGYLRVEQLRLDERLQVEWDLEELPEEAPLPMLTLQPLLENAVYHGVEPLAHPGVIRIAGRYRSGRVNLSVRNSLPPPDSRPGHREGNRIALENVRQRLLALYPDRASLSLGRVEDEFQVRLVFPYP
jgi:two-component system sensor histidine kinase AlgZ